MKHFRVKLVGFGLAVLAGSAIAADDGQQPASPASEAKPNPVVQAGGEPGLLPSPIRFNPAAGSLNNMDPIWFPAAKPIAAPVAGSLVVGASGFEATPGKVIAASSVPPASSGVDPLGVGGNSTAPGSGESNSLSTQAGQIKAISNQVSSVCSLQPLSIRILLPWLQSVANLDAWPAAGPRVGMVPPDPVPNAYDLPPISEPPTNPQRMIEPAPPVSTPPEGLRAPLGNIPPPNQLPLPAPLQSPTGLQITPTLQTTPQTAPPIVLPQPRPVDEGSRPPTGSTSPSTSLPGQPQAACELPTAPPGLMIPAGAEVPGKKGVFGSDPIRISRDYPSISDLCGTPIRDRLEAGLVADRASVDRGFVEAEYLLWWMRGLNVPTLATTSTNPAGNGFLGQPGTVPILGPGTFLGDAREGMRVRAGFWLDDCNTWAVDGSVFFLAQRDADAALGFNQYSVITRPIFSPNPIPGTGTIIGETGEAVSVPGILNGVLTVHAQSVLWGADANLRRCLLNDCDSRASVFVGYRNLDLVESLTINENIDVVGSGGNRITVTDPIGTRVSVQDRFATQNYFNGGQIGGTYERRWGGFDFDVRASVALGSTEQELDIDGFQTKTLPGQATQTFRGGLLAVGPNLGDFTRNRFSVVPEITLNAGYWLLPNLKVHVGYNFLYWTNVLRPGNQIDSTVNLAYVPNGPAVGASSQVRPQALFQQSDMLVHGVQFGIEWRW
ncbi:MAG TPA: BBP7 family outer membrane beta-barrel protein [Gemmata sp.]|jgi:hypothetical protein|nr:BBP7 family outer membrane beta-barrel protein [Gemmata sp.]